MALTILGTVGSAGTAHAGTNGQQIHFHDRRGDVHSVKIVGHDQNSQGEPSMNVLRKTALGAVTGVLALGGLSALSGTAFAGTNGQQIMFRDNQHSVASVSITGRAQNGVVVTGCFNTLSFENHLYGWWWKEEVLVTGYSHTGCAGSVTYQAHDYVPEYQENSDWVTIDD